MNYALWVIALCFAILLIKMVALHYIDKYCMQWYLSIYKYFSTSVLLKYYQSGLLFIRKQGIADLTYNTNGICYAFTTLVIPSILQSAGNICLIIVFMICFLIFSPYVALLFLFFVSLFIVAYVWLVGKDISQIGKEEIEAKKGQWETVQDCFNGYVEMEIYNAFPYFMKRFIKGINAIISCQNRMKIKTEIPAYLLEMMMLVLLIIVFLISHSTEELVLLLSAVSIGVFKILPSIKQIISGYNTLQNHLCTIDILYDAINLQCESLKRSRSVIYKDTIKFNDVDFYYDKQNQVLNRVNIEIKKGERIGIQGESGFGKTTLLNVLLGFLDPNNGQVLIDETNLADMNLQMWHQQIGYVPQEVFIADDTIAGNIAFGLSHEKMNEQKIYEVLKIVQLYDWVKALPLDINTRIGENGCLVSCGQKQRLGIARALYKKAQLLILDEATSALDEVTEKNILSIIDRLTEKDSGRTLIMVSHNKYSMKMCERFINI
nr:ABC transporter ATP-binding protein [uncultured Bacteroides sp.]